MAYIELDKYVNGYAGGLDDNAWKDKIIELFDYLTGKKLPEGVSCKMPKLSANGAMEVIWFLQEITRVLPDNFHVCAGCGEMGNTDSMQWYEKVGKYYCEGCIDYSPVAHCEDCRTEVYAARSYSKKDEMYLCKECRAKRRKKDD